MFPVRAAAALLFAILVARADAATAASARAGMPVMGTVLQVTVEADDAGAAQRAALRAIEIARHWDDVLTTWREEGELARLNAAAGQGTFAASEDLRVALQRMRTLFEVTQGAFNPAVGTLVERWQKPLSPESQPLPEPDDSKKWEKSEVVVQPAPPFAAVLAVGERGVELDAGVRLDAGAIGKGIALDEIVRELRADGASSVWLDFGGSSQLAWSRQGRARTLAVTGLADGTVLGTIELTDGAVSTSRSSAPGEEAGPIVDPGTGTVAAVRRVATVLCPAATEADAWSTALVVLGRRGLERLEAAGCEGLLEDEGGVVTTTGFPPMRQERGIGIDNGFQDR